MDNITKCFAIFQAEQISGQLETLLNTFRALGYSEDNRDLKTLENARITLNAIHKGELHTLDNDFYEVDYWLQGSGQNERD
jgi:hypothetical protein